MARVQIEERAWSDSKLKKLAARLGIPRSFAMGILASLWHDSQNESATLASDEDLGSWLADEVAAGYDVVAMLQASGYIEKQACGRYKIDGNKSRMAQVDFYKEKAKNAAKVRWAKHKKHSKDKRDRDVLGDATSNAQASESSMPQALLEQCHNSMTTNSMTTRQQEERSTSYSAFESQSSRARDAHARTGRLEVADSSCEATKLAPWETGYVADSDTRQNVGKAPRIEDEGGGATKRRRPKKNASEPKPGAVAGTSELIGYFVTLWADAYKAKYPVRGRDAGAAKEIVKAVGVERSKVLVAAYLAMKTQRLTMAKHPIRMMADDLVAVQAFAETGLQTTSFQARREELAAHNDSVIERIMARDRAKEAAKNGATDDNTIDVEAKVGG